MQGWFKCAVCGLRIGNPDSLENVAVIRHVQLPSGRSGWVSMHVRCAGKWPEVAAECYRRSPPGEPLELEPVEIWRDRNGVRVARSAAGPERPV